MMKRFLISILILFVIVPLGIAQEDDTVNTPDVSPELIDHLDTLEAITIVLRGLDALSPVEREFPSRDDLSVFLEGLFEEELTEEDVFITTLFYRALGFVDADFDLVEAYFDLLVGQIAGFYDTDTQIMNVIRIEDAPLGDSLPLLEQVTYVHEYVHVLQDQHFDLAALQEAIPEDNWDSSLALTSLIEGDATAAMTDFIMEAVLRNPMAALEILSMDLDTSMPESVPAIMETELTLPYLAGQTFVDVLRREGGWDAVNTAFANPPVSMSQILYPQRYLDGILPVEVTLVDVSEQLGEGWEFVAERTVGVFYWQEYLKLTVPTRTVEDTLQYWAGDRFAIYYHAETDQIAWVARIAWDSTEARDAFQLIVPVDYTLEGDVDMLIASAPNADLIETLINAQQAIPES